MTSRNWRCGLRSRWGAVVAAIASLGRKGKDRDKKARNATTPIARKAVSRVRVLIGVMIVSQYVTDPSRFDNVSGSLSRWQVLIASLGLLVIVNAASAAIARQGDNEAIERFTVLELIADTVLVVLLTTATGTSGIGWVLFALPIVEAAARFRLSGALLHWMGLTAITMASRIYILNQNADGSNLLIDDLEQVLDQLSVLLLVVIPGAYLAEQLVADVVTQRRETKAATTRGQLLQQVAEAGHEVNRLGGDVVETLTGAAASLGFHGVEINALLDHTWHMLGQSGTPLPEPGSPGSCLRPDDLVHDSVMVDRNDPDPSEAEGLAQQNLQTVVRLTLVAKERQLIVLRAGMFSGVDPEPAAVEALQLLASQAAVAMNNERLVSELQTMHGELEHAATPRRPDRAAEPSQVHGGAAHRRQRRDRDRCPVHGPQRVQADQRHPWPRRRRRLVAGRRETTAGRRRPSGHGGTAGW